MQASIVYLERLEIVLSIDSGMALATPSDLTGDTLDMVLQFQAQRVEHLVGQLSDQCL